MEPIEQWAADQVHALRLSGTEMDRINRFRSVLDAQLTRGCEAFNAAIGESGVQPIRLTKGAGNAWVALERGRKKVTCGIQSQALWIETATRKWSDLSDGWERAERSESVNVLRLDDANEQHPLKFENKDYDADQFARILMARVIDQK